MKFTVAVLLLVSLIAVAVEGQLQQCGLYACLQHQCCLGTTPTKQYCSSYGKEGKKCGSEKRCPCAKDLQCVDGTCKAGTTTSSTTSAPTASATYYAN